ncbi:MAG TPA: hypothetical protein VLC10_05120 [Patescibacteria group bacterium]|nr:hypothetical protein [Patescibacteria group bacterium]
MHMKPQLPHGETAGTNYERLMRHRAYLCAARVARDYGLERDRVVEAAFKAFCRFDDLGFDEEALAVAEEFGFRTLVVSAEGFITALRRLPGLKVLDYPKGSSGSEPGLPN